MKTAFIFCSSLLLLLAGCGSSENTVSDQKMLVQNASFNSWSQAPSAGSDIPERGTDLTITVRNWPEGYQPQFIIYKQRKSFKPTLDNRTGDEVVIKARIIQASSVLTETSESVDVSNRLVFANPEGDVGFIEISNWQQADQ